MERFIITKKLSKWVLTDMGSPLWAHYKNLDLDPTDIPKVINYSGKDYTYSSDNGRVASYAAPDGSIGFTLVIEEHPDFRRDRLTIRKLTELMTGADQETVDMLSYAIRRVQGKKS
jgi:hypothetical protein